MFERKFESDSPYIDLQWVARESTGIITAKLLAEKNNPQVELGQGPAATQCGPFVAFIGGLSDLKTKLLLSQVNRWRTYNPKHFVKYYSWDEKEKIITEIMRYGADCHHSEIVLIGHSYGGDTAYSVALRLAEYKPHLVTLDAVGKRSRYRIGILGIRILTIQRKNLPRPSKGIWSDISTAAANYNFKLNFSTPLGVKIVKSLSMDWCDFVAQLGAPYGYQRNADYGLQLQKKYNHCHVETMLCRAFEYSKFTGVFGEDWNPPSCH